MSKYKGVAYLWSRDTCYKIIIIIVKIHIFIPEFSVQIDEGMLLFSQMSQHNLLNPPMVSDHQIGDKKFLVSAESTAGSRDSFVFPSDSRVVPCCPLLQSVYSPVLPQTPVQGKTAKQGRRKQRQKSLTAKECCQKPAKV